MKSLNKLTKLEKIAKVWQIQLNLEYTNAKSNIRMCFNDIGSFCELLAIDHNIDFMGSGSGGMGVDLFNAKTKKAVEVKSCCTIQNATCLECGTKFNNLFLTVCPKCGSKKYKEIRDSRFGISAKELIRQYKKGIFDNFTMCYISQSNHDKKKNLLTIRLEWFRIDFNDSQIKEIQLKYFLNQAQKGRKDHCNLLPYSYDFYKLCPTKIDEFTITIDYADLENHPIIKKCKFDKKLRIPMHLIPSKDRDLFKMLQSYKDEYADAKDFTLHLDYKHKSLGKKRGDTRGKVDKVLS